MLIRDAIEEYLGAKQNSIAGTTYVWYARFLSLFVDWCEASSPRLMLLEQLTPAHVQQFVSACPTDNSHTRHARAQIVKGFLSWCALDDELGVRRKVVERIEMPRLVQSDVEIFTPADIRRLLAACASTNQPHRNRALIHVLLDTGIRAAEACYDSDRPGDDTGLRLHNVFLGRDSSYIWVMGKGNKSRTIGLGVESTQAMRRYINRERVGNKTGSDFCFLSRDGDPLSVRMLQQFLGELGDVTGVTNVHPHRFRHTFAVSQLLAGTSDLVLMRLMGHTTLDATKIYTRGMSQVQARQSAISVVDNMKSQTRKV